MENITTPAEWEQFLYDVRAYFKASLQTSEYENASNLYFAAEATEKLLTRCEQLLIQCSDMKRRTFNINKFVTKNATEVTAPNIEKDDNCYLSMESTKPKQSSTEHIAFHENNDGCNGIETKLETDQVDDYKMIDDDIYDICDVSHINKDETQKVMTYESDHLQNGSDCPHMDLPAGHLAIHRSTKYGQLLRIEKRLFFDQSKKYYCGILNDWLLCYADGPTASQPSSVLYLKSPGIEIEHSGDGKRREICFQITTSDPNKKLVFQAVNEVDAKEWIHAIEAAIRGDTAALVRNNRKLPSPPVCLQLVFTNGHSIFNNQNYEKFEKAESIYHEPDIHELEKNLNNVSSQQNEKNIEPAFNYDVPKYPPQPLKPELILDNIQSESETDGLLYTNEPNENNVIAINTTPQVREKYEKKDLEKDIFLAKIKDVHDKLSSQLAAGPTKAVKKTNSRPSDVIQDESLTSKLGTTKDNKKPKKNNTPTKSPKKISTDNHSESTEKSAKNWFLYRLNKSTPSAHNSSSNTPVKSNKQSERENLLNGLENNDNIDCTDANQHNDNNKLTSPILNSQQTNCTKSKVNMIINQFESSGNGHMFSVEALASNALASFGNYEPIMTSPTFKSFMKKA